MSVSTRRCRNFCLEVELLTNNVSRATFTEAKRTRALTPQSETLKAKSRRSTSSKSSMANRLRCTGRNVLYAGSAVPQPATITINTETGKITEIFPFYQTRDVHEPGIDEDGITWVDAGDRIVLPGLVEYVALSMTKVK